MSINEGIIKEMDEAAKVADDELTEISVVHIHVIADWYRKNYLKAGYKRLGKILLTYATKKESS